MQNCRDCDHKESAWLNSTGVQNGGIVLVLKNRRGSVTRQRLNFTTQNRIRHKSATITEYIHPYSPSHATQHAAIAFVKRILGSFALWSLVVETEALEAHPHTGAEERLCAPCVSFCFMCNFVRKNVVEITWACVSLEVKVIPRLKQACELILHRGSVEILWFTGLHRKFHCPF